MKDVVAVVADLFEEVGLLVREFWENVVVEGDGVGGVEGLREDEAV